MNKVIIDSVVFIALFNKNEQDHKKALNIFNSISKNSIFYTSDYILNEVVTFCNSVYGHKKSCEVLNSIYRSSIINLIIIDNQILNKIYDKFLITPIKNISFTDVSTVIIMKEFGINEVFSFDNHFQKMGINTCSSI